MCLIMKRIQWASTGKYTMEIFQKHKFWLLYPNLLNFAFTEARLINFEMTWLRLRNWNLKQTTQFYYFLLLSTNFRKLPLADISKDQQILCRFLSHPQTPHVMLVMKSWMLIPDGIKKYIRNSKDMLKTFGTF